MRIDRKFRKCQNCGYSLSEVYNYCPNCGQENRNDNVSFNTLLGDIFSTYFAVDSKVGRTLKPFFTKPGFLTEKYLEGKRASYTHPIRIYLIVSLFYFFTLTLFVQSDDENDEGTFKSTTIFNMLDNVQEIDQTTRIALIRNLTSIERKELKDTLSQNTLSELKGYLTNRDSLFQQQMRLAIGDSVANALGLVQGVELAERAPPRAFGQNENDLILERVDYELIDQLHKDGLSNKLIFDSLKLTGINFFEKMYVSQSIRVRTANNEEVAGYVVKNFPVMMLISIAVFALILKILYRKNQLYIKHLIHALHLHSFAYLIYGLFILITLYLVNDNISILLNMLAFIGVTTYSYLSFLHVYEQKWFKTLLKFWVTGSIYFFSLFFFFLIELAISLLLF